MRTTLVFLVLLAPVAAAIIPPTPPSLGTLTIPFWANFHADIDWTTATAGGDSAARYSTNLVCEGRAASSFEEGAIIIYNVASSASYSINISVSAARPECPSNSGAGWIRITDNTGSWAGYAHAQTMSSTTATLSGGGYYSAISGTVSFAGSFTGAEDPDSGFGTLLDGSITGSATN